MAQTKVLIDTNVYVRLAKSICPLLCHPFGEADYCLYILPVLEDELERSSRMQEKFPWINDEEYVENRECFLTISRKQRKAISDAHEHIWKYVQRNSPGPSSIDTLYIAHASELEIRLATDDQNMATVAREFGVTVWSSLELLRVMLDYQRVDKATVDSIYNYWDYTEDLPFNAAEDYRQLFPKKNYMRVIFTAQKQYLSFAQGL